jgi:hypothetical protein
VCLLAVTAGPEYGKAVSASPLFLAWGVLIVAEGVFAWAGLLPTLWALRRLWTSTSLTTHRYLGGATGAIAVSIIAFLVGLPVWVPRLDVTWPLGSYHPLRVGVVGAVVILPALSAILTMWLAAASADAPPPNASRVPIEVVRQYLENRGIVQACLWFLGVVIGITVLATGMLRQSMVAGKFAEEAKYPASLPLAYGAFFTLVVLLCYAPAYALIRRAGNRLLHDLLSSTTDLLTWDEQQSKFSRLLGLDLRLDQSVKDSVAILGPLLAGLMSTALPK